ncbi:carbohydrate kinase family protein [Patescibacteria group bacterium]|nr:carbohydrate kinase family protein [Patescibacteria group bacterium]
MTHDIIAIGDIVIDAFISLSKTDAQVVCDASGRACKLQMNFGEKLPYESVEVINAVGNSPNATVAAHRLGLKTALVSNVGHDRNGKDCIDTLRKEGISTEFVRLHEGKFTNYHYVLRYGAERTILIKHEQFAYALPRFENAPRYIYLSSLGSNSLPFHHELGAYLKKNPEIKLAFQPGTFQIRLGIEELKDIYAATEIFFCNKEEAQYILKTEEKDISVLLKRIKELGPKIPVITDGNNGAYALDGDSVWFMPIYPDPAPPVDRTGAGDAFASTFTSAVALGHDIKTALSWGPINSMSVVQYVGAQKGLLTQKELENFLKNAPTDYQAQKI